MLPRIKNILSVEPFSIKVLWNTGEIRVIELEKELKTGTPSVFEKLLDKKTFSSVKLDEEAGTIYWENLLNYKDLDGTIKPGPLDFCPDVLYELSTPILK